MIIEVDIWIIKGDLKDKSVSVAHKPLSSTMTLPEQVDNLVMKNNLRLLDKFRNKKF